MKVSYKLDYALKTMAALAMQENTLISIQELSKKLDIPRKFLEQILTILKKGDFVVSKRGNIGGYLLARPANQIMIGDIIRHLDGPLEPIACLDNGYQGCLDMPSCVFREVWDQVHLAIKGVVDHISLADIVARFQANQRVADYSI